MRLYLDYSTEAIEQLKLLAAHNWARGKAATRTITDYPSEYAYWKKMDAIYRFPAFTELVAEPSKKNWRDGELDPIRKAELLLLGHFRWGKYSIIKSGMDWLLSKKRYSEELCIDYYHRLERLNFLYVRGTKEQLLERYSAYPEWVLHWEEDDRIPDIWKLSLKDLNLELSSLRSLMAEHLGVERLVFRDGNCFNLNPDNLVIRSRSRKGRKARCSECRVEMGADKEFIILGKRYCDLCRKALSARLDLGREVT